MVKGEQESVERKGFCSFDSNEFLTSISDLKFHKISWVNLLSKFRLSQSVCLSLKKNPINTDTIRHFKLFKELSDCKYTSYKGIWFWFCFLCLCFLWTFIDPHNHRIDSCNLPPHYKEDNSLHRSGATGLGVHNDPLTKLTSEARFPDFHPVLRNAS